MISDHKTYLTYGDLRYIYVESDAYPEKDGYIYDFYTKQAVLGTWDGGKTYNREHVWCCSLTDGLWEDVGIYTKGGGADLLHIRPLISSYNSGRNNKPYAELTSYTTSAYGYYNSSYFMPFDNVKGNIARELMYVYVHYSTAYGGLTNAYTGSLDITKIVYTPQGTEEASFDLLLSWNELDPVEDSELLLNDVAEKEQGNRNPFIDNPEYAEMIWGN